MNIKTTLQITIFAFLIISCASKKNMDSDKLYNTSWELEYISGPRIAFNGLYPDKKPKISFDKTTNKVEGNNSCNGYSADYTLNGKEMSFGEPGPTTMMFCGEGEKVFLNTMKKINKYSFDEEGKLNLMIDDVTMMRFRKVQ
ncbi:META domain-containing protein [uncultured Wocania sp.]|uniref:META domain-containing protein n=1 Tax=uncultured Wocania sp. TaxID=2834404 RepID=UPI0030F9B6E9